MFVRKKKYDEVVRQNELLQMELGIVRNMLNESDWQNMTHKRIIAAMERHIKQLKSQIQPKEL